MSFRSLHRKVASEILGCGKRKIWIDPNEIHNISFFDSRCTIKKALKNGSILKKFSNAHSRNSIRKRNEAKLKGRHSGIGKREGTKNSRSNSKTKWIFKLRVLRRLLKNYRKNFKIDKHLHRDLYLKCKGNVFKNKKSLADFVFKARIESERKKAEMELMNKKKEKQKNLRLKKAEKFNLKVQKVYKKSENENLL